MYNTYIWKLFYSYICKSNNNNNHNNDMNAMTATLMHVQGAKKCFN